MPRAVTADRGYGQAAVEHDLQALGVRTAAIPRQAKISPGRKATEHGPGFRKLVKWRTGSEGRISYLKHTYGWNRTRLDGKKEPRSGADTGYSLTTWSRSAPWPANRPHMPAAPPSLSSTASSRHHAGGFFRSK